MTVQAKTTSLPATLFVPEFLRLEQREINTLLHVLRDPLTTHVFLLLQAHSDFKTGEFLGGYHRLMELCTPPIPERGQRRPGPSYWQLRRVVDDLIKFALAARDATQNALQGQLRLQLTPRERKAAPAPLDRRISRRVIKSENLGSMRVVASPMDDSPQDIPQGFHGVNTPLIPQTDGVIHSPMTPARQAGIAALKALQGTITRPPEGAQKAPHGGRGRQVALSALMPSASGEGSTQEQPSISKGGVQAARMAATG